MMDKLKFGEAIGVPAQHVRFHLIDRVPSRSLPQASNRFPASSAINLGCASYMELRIGFKFLHSTKIVINVTPTYAELGITLKMSKAFFKVVGGQSQVAVKLHNEVPVFRLKCVVAVIEGFDDSTARFSKPAVRPVYNADPRHLSRVPIDNFAGPFSGPAVDDDPFHRRYRLAPNGNDRRLDELLLVAYRRNNYVSCHFCCAAQTISALRRTSGFFATVFFLFMIAHTPQHPPRVKKTRIIPPPTNTKRGVVPCLSS